MKIILATRWQPGYWQQGGTAPFSGALAGTIPQVMDIINDNCPIVGIGYYKRSPNPVGATGNENFEYIKINGITQNGPADFSISYEFIRTSNTQSNILSQHIPGLYFLFYDNNNENILINILHLLHEDIPVIIEPPIINVPPVIIIPPVTYWHNYIGNYFLELRNNGLGDGDFEDRVYKLLVALGFDVKQEGHTTPGAYPDGTITIQNYKLIYDCKNRDNYFPVQADVNQMTNYINNNNMQFPNFQNRGIFIARNFGNIQNRHNYFYYKVDDLLYLYFKKIILGNNFNINSLLLVVNQNVDINPQNIDLNFPT